MILKYSKIIKYKLLIYCVILNLCTAKYKLLIYCVIFNLYTAKYKL